MSGSSTARQEQRRLLAPEVVQTSAMDCGPAALKCVLEGFGIPASYGRLREACQTDVDGTSINTLEDVAVGLGLDAEQVLIPVDHLLLPCSHALPSILVVRLPNKNSHFVVAWRSHGPLVQLMDPATGRRWLSPEQLLREVYGHHMDVEGETWRGWASAPEFQEALRTRLMRLGLRREQAQQRIDSALSQPGWRRIAELDASTRMLQELIQSRGVRKGSEAEQVLDSLLADARQAEDPTETIPSLYWAARPSAAGEEFVTVRGAILIRIQGRRPGGAEAPGESPQVLSRELREALAAPPEQPARQLWRLLRADGHLALWPLLLGLLLVTAATVLEVVLFRSLIDLGATLAQPRHRLAALGLFVLLSAALLLLELPISRGLRRLGRVLEGRLRVEFLRKLPYLGDRYFQSRLSSDMAHRSHDIYQLRGLPELGGRAVQLLLEMGVSTVGILLLAPRSLLLALALCAAVMLIPLAALPLLAQSDMRTRTHNGALARLSLDSLLGLMPIRAHGAERSVRREHEGLLVKWMEASLRFQGLVTLLEGVASLCGFGLAAWLLAHHLGAMGGSGTVLLLVYWLLRLPMLGRELTAVALEYPAQRNATLRLLEPLGAPMAMDAKQPLPPPEDSPTEKARGGVSFELRGVTISVSGHTILEDISLSLGVGEHVAVVGPSGAGKSTLAGVLLGFHRAAAGSVSVEGRPFEGALIEWLRQHTAWVDPAVRLWDQSLLGNLVYGASGTGAALNTQILSQAELLDLLEALPEGLQTPLGEGGGKVSGGEGQRVRFGRALHRPQAKLIILDEPFRGLDRERRRALLARTRELWRDATLLCITHDVTETKSFPRVLVVDQKHLVEDGKPEALDRPGTRYRELLDAGRTALELLEGGREWRRIRLDGARDSSAEPRQAS